MDKQEVYTTLLGDIDGLVRKFISSANESLIDFEEIACVIDLATKAKNRIHNALDRLTEESFGDKALSSMRNKDRARKTLLVLKVLSGSAEEWLQLGDIWDKGGHRNMGYSTLSAYLKDMSLDGLVHRRKDSNGRKTVQYQISPLGLHLIRKNTITS